MQLLQRGGHCFRLPSRRGGGVAMRHASVRQAQAAAPAHWKRKGGHACPGFAAQRASADIAPESTPASQYNGKVSRAGRNERPTGSRARKPTAAPPSDHPSLQLSKLTCPTGSPARVPTAAPPGGHHRQQRSRCARPKDNPAHMPTAAPPGDHDLQPLSTLTRPRGSPARGPTAAPRGDHEWQRCGSLVRPRGSRARVPT
eukprot:CAMPEP_0206063622 /NCGR_PEP_ID=MMETSP1466-20131121/58323_1 /ASSEMBLY_ACC=CAM_ASM_001126 /TAXON_ID=44452 /ORGANISM="Pavlova gyrans, Strain CCMP608" /LENGTH=199 /DNA_ID=CAMNT_0053438993 /DNA_START=128 /DNA_END=728 /DNA_ORIENTATION=-